LEAGTWHGAIASGYGWHAVYLSERVEGRVPDLAEIRDVVERELMFVRREEMNAGIYGQFRDRYAISIEMPEGLAPDSTGPSGG
jgi:parvulin-like peptidyl-prolyl isomerase